jgi:hypothetical protein
MGVSSIARGCAALVGAAGVLLPAVSLAHGIAGDRFFPATLSVDDPAVADELSLPTVSYLEGDAAETDISAEYSKRLTSTLGVSFGGTWTRDATLGEPIATGFQNLETTLKWQALTSAEHEAIVAAGVSVEWGGTGSQAVGAEPHTTITPTLYFGKGLGDLRSLDWIRPFAVTGQLGYAIPSQSRDPESGEVNPKVLQWGLTLQYSLPYLQQHVRDVGLPAPFDRMTPLVEASLETPLTGPVRTTTGTVNPGVIWAGRHFQLGAEALVPVNSASGRHVGAIVQFHMFLDDLFPRSIGKPIW